MRGIIECAMIVALIWTAYSDCMTKRVSVNMLGIICLLSVSLRIFFATTSWWGTLGGVCIGLLFLGISRWSEEAIGYGDSWLILSLGIFLGGKKLVELIFLSGFLSSVFSIYYCLRHGWNRRSTIPYVPFVAVAYLGSVFL